MSLRPFRIHSPRRLEAEQADDADPPRPQNLGRPHLGKKPSKIGGFRYFAIGRNIGEERTEGCGLYEGGATVTLSYQDKEVIVTDARTGKEVARKTFSPAKSQCPSYTTDGGSTISSVVEPGDVEPWLDEIRKR